MLEKIVMGIRRIRVTKAVITAVVVITIVVVVFLVTVDTIIIVTLSPKLKTFITEIARLISSNS